MTDVPPAPTRRRNRAFAATHDAIVGAAVRLIAAHGAEALSMAAVARAAAVNRTTLYYHFADRAALLAAVQAWSGEQLARGLETDRPQAERIDAITRFVLDQPALMKLWIDDFIAPGDIRERYPAWDALVAGFAPRTGGQADAEVAAILLLTAAFIAPRIYRLSIRPDAPEEDVVDRFRRAQQRWLELNGLVRDPA